jgi:HPt (histidine-containing phosphotransfer) domain-containing protein
MRKTMSLSPADIDDHPRPGRSRPEIAAINTRIDTVDMAVLTSLEEAQSEGNPDLVVELIDLYLKEAARLLTVVQQALDMRDQSAIKDAVHSLRGSSSSLGILQMALICDELERTEFNDMFPIASELLICLKHEFSRVSQVLLLERQRRLK